MACPLCQVNLDLRQADASKAHGELPETPVLYVTQLLGLALGLSPEGAGPRCPDGQCGFAARRERHRRSCRDGRSRMIQKTATASSARSDGNGKEPVGAVLVCGGGVAGIQASLDLSAAGFRVYLVEESPTIGGGMARLDKTFPTGDCATCIISPKLVECMRDHNIDVLHHGRRREARRRGRQLQGHRPTAPAVRRRRQVHRLRRLHRRLPGRPDAAASTRAWARERRSIGSTPRRRPTPSSSARRGAPRAAPAAPSTPAFRPTSR